MDSRCISSLFSVRSAFLRSVDVAEDYDDPRSSEHYVVTDLVHETLQRVSSGLRHASSQRAWRLTGDYGTGKSSFALALARIAAGEDERLPPGLRNWMKQRVRLEPVLVTGDLESLRTCILRGVKETEIRVFGSSETPLSVSTNEEVLIIFDKLGDRIRANNTGDGLLLVLDELGQNLRYAAQHPDDDDIYLLQRLGERSVRSNGKPLMILALLHQGFASYSAAADVVAKKEWDKVAGRFEEIVFAQPVEQTAILVAETLGIKTTLLPKKVSGLMRAAMQQAVSCGLYGSLSAEEYLVSLAPRLFPLNPVVLPVLTALLRKFGQNERSIVSFLTSFEPFGLRAFADRVSIEGNLYKISDLYDYFKSNLSQLGVGPFRARWEIAESVVDKGAGYGEVAERLLKSVAILNMIDDPAIPSTREVLLASETGADASDTIDRLISELRLLHERGTARGLSLWPHTSANLEDLLRQADEALGSKDPHPSVLLDYLPKKQLVARRHYVKTGNLRHFSVNYVQAKDAERALKSAAELLSEDGTIVVIVPFSAEEQRAAVELTKSQILPKHLIVGVSEPVVGISHVLSDIKRWEWVRKNARELSFDQFALEYLREEVELLKATLHRELEFLVDFIVDHKRPIQWFYHGSDVKFEEYRGILGFISTVCEDIYSDCPTVRNELINRRVTSAAASRARTLLIEAIATHQNEEFLGINNDRNPPELAIYLSVLMEGKLHIKEANSWRFVKYSELTEDPCRFGPSLKCIHNLLLKADLDSVSVETIYKELRRPPYGVRDGLLPLLVAVYLAGHWEETSVYEDGTFLLKVGGEEIQRLNKEPEMFALQHCSVSGVRLAVYDQLSRVFGPGTTHRPDILTVIRPLVSFAVSLPEYVRHAREVLSPRTRKVRDLLFAARQPATLLFKEIPEALGFPVIDAVNFQDDQISGLVKGLNEAITELRNAYPALLCRIRNGLQDAFNSKGDFDEFRHSIAHRSVTISDHIYDLDFKAFVLRLADSALSNAQWIESVATLVAKKSPERWHSTDEAIFFENLEALVPRFLRVESIYFEGAATDGALSTRCVRFTVTRPDGSEIQEVLNWKPEDDDRVETVKTTLDSLVAQHGQIALAAAVGLLWQQQHRTEKV